MPEIPSPPSANLNLLNISVLFSFSWEGGREEEWGKGRGVENAERNCSSLATSPRSKDNAAKVRYQDNCLKAKHSDSTTESCLHKILQKVLTSNS